MKVDNGPPRTADAAGLRVAVITSSFNRSITDGLRDGAIAYLEEVNTAEILSVAVPGAFELPLIAQKLARDGFDAVVCLGAVIDGDTDHYEHVAHRTSEGLMRVQLDTGVPIAFGVLTVRTVEAARLRSMPNDDNKGREAAMAAVETAFLLANL